MQVVKAAVDPDMQADTDKLGRPCLHHTCNVYQKCNTIEQHQQQLTPEVAEVAHRLGMVIMPYQEVYLRALGPVSVSLHDRLKRTPAWLASLAAAGEAGEVQQAAADAADTLNALPAMQAELLLGLFSPQRQQLEVGEDTASNSGSYASLAGLQEHSEGVGSSNVPPVANLAAAFDSQADGMQKLGSEPKPAAAASSQASAAAQATAAVTTGPAAAEAAPEQAAPEQAAPEQAAPEQAVPTPEQHSVAAGWVGKLDSAFAAYWDKKAAAAGGALPADEHPDHVPVGWLRECPMPKAIRVKEGNKAWCELYGPQLGVRYGPQPPEQGKPYYDLAGYRQQNQQQ